MRPPLAELVIETLHRQGTPLPARAIADFLGRAPVDDVAAALAHLLALGEVETVDGPARLYKLVPPQSRPSFRIIRRREGPWSVACNGCLASWTVDDEPARRMVARIAAHYCPTEGTR